MLIPTLLIPPLIERTLKKKRDKKGRGYTFKGSHDR